MKKNKRYFAVASLEGKDELYWLPKTKEKEFEKKFGKFDSFWPQHEEALDWLRKNGNFIGHCTCLAY